MEGASRRCQRLPCNIVILRHLKAFSQPTKYAHVLGYIKTVQDRWGSFEKIRVDYTREGPSIITDMTIAGIENAEGVNFSVPRKSEMAGLLKQRMVESTNLFIRCLTGKNLTEATSAAN